jgi:hypothetical protein
MMRTRRHAFHWLSLATVGAFASLLTVGGCDRSRGGSMTQPPSQEAPNTSTSSEASVAIHANVGVGATRAAPARIRDEPEVSAPVPGQHAGAQSTLASSAPPDPWHADDTQRLTAIAELAGEADAGSWTVLADVAARDTSTAVRQEALYGLAEIGDAGSVMALERALEDPDPGIRRAAVQGMRLVGTRDVEYGLQLAAQDEDPKVRNAARDALDDLDETSSRRLTGR